MKIMIDNKKMWEVILAQCSVSWVNTLIKKALNEQGLEYKNGEIITIASEEIRGNQEKTSPKSGLYMCTAEEANTLNAAAPEFYVGAIYKYDENKGINIGDGWLGISDETLLKYFCPVEKNNPYIKKYAASILQASKKQLLSKVNVDAIVERHSPSDGVTVQKYAVRAFVRNIVKDVLEEIQKQ